MCVNIFSYYFVFYLGESGDDDKYINEDNFRAILKFKANDLDSLKDHLSYVPEYQYTNRNIQNEIINISGNLILGKLVKMVNSAECFSVLADETTDVSLKEQLTLCVRYVNGSGESVKVRESFLEYVEIHSLTRKDVASAILEGTITLI